MSNRDDNLAWLLRESERFPDGWEATALRLYGQEGALDLLDTQDGRLSHVNLSRRPFANDEEFKRLVREARLATFGLSRYAYSRMFEDMEADRAIRALGGDQT